eukprot:747493-Hanusia_phi.AAC.1
MIGASEVWRERERAEKGEKSAKREKLEVISELRRQFNMADKDGSGEIDAEEACDLFSQFCCPNATIEEIRRTSSSLRNQMDQDRNGRISFEEYAFRFGRKLQMEIARRRREGKSIDAGAGAAGKGQGGGYKSIYPSAEDEHDSNLRQRMAASSNDSRMQAHRPKPGAAASSPSAPLPSVSSPLSREFLTVAGIALVLLLLVLFAVISEGSSKNFNARSRTR